MSRRGKKTHVRTGKINGKNTRKGKELPRFVTQDSEPKMEGKLKQTERPINYDERCGEGMEA